MSVKTHVDFKQQREARIQSRYASVGYTIKDNIGEAYAWAVKELTNLEGSGHDLYVSARGTGVCCSFAKPEWQGDHCGHAMDHGAEAIVMAVCEYLEGA